MVASGTSIRLKAISSIGSESGLTRPCTLLSSTIKCNLPTCLTPLPPSVVLAHLGSYSGKGTEPFDSPVVKASRCDGDLTEEEEEVVLVLVRAWF